MRSRSAAPLTLGIKSASRPGFTTAARSSSVSPVSSALTRTMNVQARFASGLDQPGDMGAGAGLFGGRDGIFEVENEGVGPAILGPGELAFGIAGNEQERAQSHVGPRL